MKDPQDAGLYAGERKYLEGEKLKLTPSLWCQDKQREPQICGCAKQIKLILFEEHESSREE